MAAYQLAPVGVIDTATGAHVAPSGANPAWVAYLDWLRTGNVPDPMDAPTVDLEQVRAELIAGVNELRAMAVASGVTFNGYAFDSDDISRSNLTAVVAAVTAGVPLPDGFTWRTTDNQDAPMDAAGLVQLAGVMLAHGEACYRRSWALKAELAAADDPRAVDLGGWPT